MCVERFPESIFLRVASVVGGIAMLASCETVSESSCTGEKQYVLQEGETAIGLVEEKAGAEANIMDLQNMNPDVHFQELEPGDPFYGPEFCPSDSN